MLAVDVAKLYFVASRLTPYDSGRRGWKLHLVKLFVFEIEIRCLEKNTSKDRSLFESEADEVLQSAGFAVCGEAGWPDIFLTAVVLLITIFRYFMV